MVVLPESPRPINTINFSLPKSWLNSLIPLNFLILIFLYDSYFDSPYTIIKLFGNIYLFDNYQQIMTNTKEKQYS